MATRQEYNAIVIGAGRAALFLGPPLVQAGWPPPDKRRDRKEEGP